MGDWAGAKTEPMCIRQTGAGSFDVRSSADPGHDERIDLWKEMRK